MLTELTIRNFAIIDDLTIRFSDGLTILSGETGAGKSIIINAVNLLLGSRASDRLVRTGAESAELEALFEINPESPVAALMRENDLDPEDGLLARRIISATGRANKIYINGRLATIKLLNDLTENLASISGQHAHQGLLNADGHLDILDQFGGLMPQRDSVAEIHGRIVPRLDRLARLMAGKDRQAEKIALLEFQKNEIAAAAIAPGEDEALDLERARLRNAENLYRTVFEAVEELYNAPDAVGERLMGIARRLEKAGQIDPELTARSRGVQDAVYAIEDAVAGLRDYLSGIQADPARLDAVEERLDALKKLKRKYGGSLEAALDHAARIEAELSAVENTDAEIQSVTESLAADHRRLTEAAGRLSAARSETARALSEKVVAELETLRMGNTRFEVAIEPIPASADTNSFLRDGDHAIGLTGADRATFMIAPNVGEALKPLAAIASGGELSRVVLALKAILARAESVETVVFDEVDAGVGGGVAEMVGRKLAALAAFHQVICITHLPQIARFGRHHFRIEKKVTDGRTRTDIALLDAEQRVAEIARMLGGVDVTEKTMEHAREMLSGE